MVGIALSDGQWEAALGAMVLFLTNFLSILLAGTWESESEYEVRRIDAQDEGVGILIIGEGVATNFSDVFRNPGQGPAASNARDRE